MTLNTLGTVGSNVPLASAAAGPALLMKGLTASSDVVLTPNTNDVTIAVNAASFLRRDGTTPMTGQLNASTFGILAKNSQPVVLSKASQLTFTGIISNVNTEQPVAPALTGTAGLYPANSTSQGTFIEVWHAFFVAIASGTTLTFRLKINALTIHTTVFTAPAALINTLIRVKHTLMLFDVNIVQAFSEIIANGVLPVTAYTGGSTWDRTIANTITSSIQANNTSSTVNLAGMYIKSGWEP